MVPSINWTLGQVIICPSWIVFWCIVFANKGSKPIYRASLPGLSARKTNYPVLVFPCLFNLGRITPGTIFDQMYIRILFKSVQLVVFWPKRGIFFWENWLLYSESGRGVLYHWPGQSICIQPVLSGAKTARINDITDQELSNPLMLISSQVTNVNVFTKCFCSPMLVVIRDLESHLKNHCSSLLASDQMTI